jgi:hypothetical protein
VNRSLGVQLGGSKGGEINLPGIPIFDPDGHPNDRMVAAHAAARQKTVNIENAANAEGFDFSGTREFNRRTGYVSQSFLTVPLIDHHRDTIGVLQLINALDPETGAIRAFSERGPSVWRSPWPPRPPSPTPNADSSTSSRSCSSPWSPSSTTPSTRSRPIPASTANGCRS